MLMQFFFSYNVNAVFLQNDHHNGLLMGHNFFLSPKVGPNSEILHTWKVYGIFICHPILMQFFLWIDWAESFCYSNKIVSTLVFNMHLWSFPCLHAAVASSFALSSPLFFLLSWSITLQYCSPQTFSLIVFFIVMVYNITILYSTSHLLFLYVNDKMLYFDYTLIWDNHWY